MKRQNKGKIFVNEEGEDEEKGKELNNGNIFVDSTIDLLLCDARIME